MKPLHELFKLITVLTLMFIFSIGCSKDSDVKDGDYTFKCYTVKEKNTEIPLGGAIIRLTMWTGAFEPLSDFSGNSDQNGKACIKILSGRVKSISCHKEGYKSFSIIDLPNSIDDFSEIFLEPE